jgi:hypothetical protein
VSSRYSRDEILLQALDLAHAPTVTTHDIVGNTIQPQAWSIKWLQSALDFLHRMYPFSSGIAEVDLMIPANTDYALLATPPIDLRASLYLPSDFILDVRNGIFVTPSNSSVQYNLGRVDYQRWLGAKLAYQNGVSPNPVCYSIAQKRYKILPAPSETLQATAHYFALPPEPGPEDDVEFPDEFTLIEYVKLKAQEWSRSRDVPPGTAQKYLIFQLANLRASGLLNEAEYDGGIPLENNQAIPENNLLTRNAWMGQYAY